MQYNQNLTYAVRSASLNRSLFDMASATVVRPGQPAPALLALFFEQRTQRNGWQALKSHFAAAAGSMEDALEYAVKRTNEEMGAGSARDYGGCIAIAVDQRTFAAASGGSASISLLREGKDAVDISPARTPAVREKYLAALTAGAHAQGAITVVLHREAGDPVSSEKDATAVIAPVYVNNCARTLKAMIASAAVIARALSHPASYQRAGRIIREWTRNPMKAAADAVHMARKVFPRLRAWFTNLPRTRKTGVLGAVALCMLMLHVLLTAFGSRNVEQIIAETLKRENTIAALTSQNRETEALGLLDDTLRLLAVAPSRLNDTQEETIENLRSRLLKTAAAINKVSIIASPQPVVSMEKSFRAQHTFDLYGLALARGKLYTVNRAEKEIYELDGRERRIVILKTFPDGAGMPTGIVSSMPGVVLFTTENPRGVLALDIGSREFTFAPLTLPHAESQPIAFASYHQKLYVLDARTRAIYRYERTPQGYNLWSAWTDEASLDFSQATTFTIDGSIYVTFSDHGIVKLTQGKRAPFAVESIRPPLARVEAIATKEDSPFLYLLDPPQRRAVIIEKESGALVAQYTSPLFTDLRGIFPDEAAKRIYLLNGDTVYSVGPEDESLLDLN